MSTVRKSHSRMLAACWRRNSAQLASSRIGDGSIPASLRIVQTVLAASLIPSQTSSPWIRRYPQLGFSRASRTNKPLVKRGTAFVLMENGGGLGEEGISQTARV